MYLIGEGTQPSVEEAVHWLTLAARQGYTSAQTNLGLLFFKYARKPACSRKEGEDLGLVASLSYKNTDKCCFYRRKMMRKEGRMWLSIAASQGDVDAKIALKRLCKTPVAITATYLSHCVESLSKLWPNNKKKQDIDNYYNQETIKIKQQGNF